MVQRASAQALLSGGQGTTPSPEYHRERNMLEAAPVHQWV